MSSPELRLSDDEFKMLAGWQVDCYVLEHPIKQLNDFHFLAAYNTQDVRLGTDFFFGIGLRKT
ncbi:MAG: hypothetical protein R3E08_01460 [Thiotrichaceae bacterium]